MNAETCSSCADRAAANKRLTAEVAQLRSEVKRSSKARWEQFRRAEQYLQYLKDLAHEFARLLREHGIAEPPAITEVSALLAAHFRWHDRLATGGSVESASEHRRRDPHD